MARVESGKLAEIPIGVLFILAMSSVGIYGVMLAGWSSNNKYSLMGGLRSSAQMISYELPLGISVIGVVLVSGSLDLVTIVEGQSGWGGMHWNVFFQPLGFITYVIAAFAETNRVPFDLPEAETELVAGYHTEVIKFLPPLTISKPDVDWFLSAMEDVLAETQRVPGAAWETVSGLAKRAVWA